ncbi:TetR/AcrR family transcriptional regulator [Leptospira sp. GIMC2001]|uniref:TetR/AcrR family transcriptional regulator n=1 Tax=Leptospira sp. GIMC2001 TaxID=1513297 RepID=UPI00234B1CDA|nr:TetR/AcrR family transcriptional regulator [Leptospira sp. GIMC2001]WCL48604.1 TetR/AcrR family transcriptional regulator [Leptospira sp. GIMC2001]
MNDKPKERILETSQRLFYIQGYDATGINQILEESGTHKNSLYKYFPSKKDLGIAYLESQKISILDFVKKLSQQNPNLKDFIRTWINMILRQTRSDQFMGCPFANFSSQTLSDRESFHAVLKSALNDWIQIIGKYFEDCKKDRQLPESMDPYDLATQLISIYEGNVQMYLISHDKNYIKRIETDFLARIT